MQKIQGVYCPGTKTCTIFKSWEAISSLTYCILCDIVFLHFIKKSRGSNFALMKCIWRSYILRRWNIAMVVISKFRIFKLRSDFKEKYCLNKNKTRMFHLFEISLSYFSLQSFAIPGSIFLSILSGYLFPFPLALSMVCLVSINRVCV